jgi:FkbM family methyltransferase
MKTINFRCNSSQQRLLFNKTLNKLSIFLKSLKRVQNWYLIPLAYYKLIRKKYMILTLKNKYRLKLRVDSTDLQAFTNVWLIEEYKKNGFQILDKDTIIDIGAHIGLFSTYASQFCKSGKIISFEPIKENYDLLIENIRANNLTNVHCFNKAVSDQRKILRIYLSNDQAAHSSLVESSRSIEVESVSLKEIMDSNNVSVCDFLKLDCEGAEYEILNALPDEYFNRIMKIVMEYHFFETKSHFLEKLKGRLKTLHYNVYDLPLSNGLGLLFIKK